jgi:hypothetical protein
LDQSFHGFFGTLLGDERCPFVVPCGGSRFSEFQVAFRLREPVF